MRMARWNVRILLLSSIVIALLAPTACRSLAQSDRAIRYGGQYYPEEFVLQGYPQIWEQHGVKVEHTLFSSGTENNQALISGDVDINIGADSKTVSLFSAMPDQALIIATSQRGDRYSTVVKPGSTYQSWSDLKGKKVATRLGTGAEQVLRRYFDKSPDVEWEDFEWVNMNIEDMVAALANGSVEAFTAWEPTPAIAESQGVGRVLQSYGDVALVPVFIHTTVNYAKEHRAEIVRFLAAHLDKAELIKSDPDRAAALAVKAASEQGTDVSADAFKRVFARVDFALELDQSALLALQDTAQFLVQQGQIEAVPEFRWDASFLEEAKRLRTSE